MVKAIWSVIPISISAHLKVLIVKLIWIWNCLWKWIEYPHFQWTFIWQNPTHGFESRYFQAMYEGSDVSSASCVQTLGFYWHHLLCMWRSAISFQAVETSLLYIKILNICSFLGWVYLFASQSVNMGSSQSHQVSTVKCRSKVQLNILYILRVVGLSTQWSTRQNDSLGLFSSSIPLAVVTDPCTDQI